MTHAFENLTSRNREPIALTVVVTIEGWRKHFVDAASAVPLIESEIA